MSLQAPHQPLRPSTPREHFLVALFDKLWSGYRAKMPFVQTYEKVIAEHGARFTNDHIAFRTLALQDPASGIFSLSRIFESLGYVARTCYEFPDKHLSSIHYQYPKEGFPKVFITQLKTWELPAGARKILARHAAEAKPSISDADLSALWNLSGAVDAKLLGRAARAFTVLPWDVPQRKDVIRVDKTSQFGAWVLVNGRDVNHFTASVDSHGVESLGDIEKVVAAMKAAGIPMKPEIEGERGSKLRQTATEAVMAPASMKDGKKTVRVPWSYAYFEIAERPLLTNPSTGQKERFEGFLGGQATNLFEMTKVGKP